MFDRILVVDWSAANTRKTGRDAIWIADTAYKGDDHLQNCATRHEAMERIAGAVRDELRAGHRIFIGFDFAFGYPLGSEALPGGGAWEPVWKHLTARIVDGEDNTSNRFEVAANLNTGFEGRGPFWGYPHQHHGRYAGLPFTRPDYDALGIRERRHVERRVRAASPTWKLSGNGAVGGQTLVGIPRLQQLRDGFGNDLAIWPFETAFADRLTAPAIVAEIYPSLWPVDTALHDVKDAQQVATLARGFSSYRDRGEFAALLDGPRRDDLARADALTHEGWIVGFADETLPL